MNIETRNKILTVVLGVVIIGLTYWLYDSIVTPYQTVIKEQEMTEKVRERMLSVKDALIQFEARNDSFPPTEGGLDSLVLFVKSDSLMSTMADSLLADSFDGAFNADSLIYSPRPPHNRFIYALNDTLRPPMYLLEDPDSDDAVGSLERTTMKNAPNWN